MVEDRAGQSAPVTGAARQASVRCAAAFALIAGQQERGGARGYPPMALRGREYMVRVGGALIGDGADVAQVGAAMRDAAAALADPATLAAVMPPCLSLLDAEVPTFAPPTLPQCVLIARRAGDAPLADRLEARLRAEMAAAGRAANEADAILAAEAATGIAGEGDAAGRHHAATCEALAKAG
ncbi:hypothetical protein [Croceicoccus sp. BE223]|uniref:hypothetical protein n=1 Tax=Croceicoccus sp. BE223 TaxID=2817716 RepID=UPI0028568FE0|nr:hypothetical protein [Croceicoccus sp. BE223]MDR7100931.1 hypothetical protein [Croceicoccus sp. BE223]